MAKKLGNDYRLFVRAADGTTFSQPAGQGNLTRNGGKNFTSNATKDTEGYDTQQPGLRTLTLKQDMIPSLPDPTGYTRMETLDKANGTEMYQIRKKPFATGDVVFEAIMYTGLDDTSFNQGTSVTVGVTLTLAEAPTVDALT
ncbi:hypothetical protein KCP91_08165 [Microvirga sp. SRT01]|uniref:Phage tail protein n=1 Tax=Sphingomonas longa TaxID=2778730 RepID=A0ABS2D604_9SPHN|nr:MULTISPECIES: hypothetical protein [Alphaproteobacteria]MBM6576345.1 hypothetical protein [Sphingomonas sp. BT552]MBR7709391.1 hypothetical protein [Microvirga sp. SRT01]